METNLSNSSDPNIIIDISYMMVGTAAMVANLTILIVLFSDKKLLSQSALMAGFAINHFLLALNIGAAGLVRTIYRSENEQKVSALFCVNLIYPIAYPWAFQSGALLLTMAGVERLTAVGAPHWFHRCMSDRRMWYLVVLALTVVLPSVGCGIWLATFQPITTRQCSQSAIFGKPYTAYGRAASGMGGTIAVSFTISALIIGRRHIRKLPLLSGEAGKMKKQLQLTRAMLSVSFVDFCLVVIPNSISFLSTIVDLTLPSFMGSPQSNVAYCVNAVPAILSYLIFNGQFRKAFWRLFRLGSMGVSTVAPLEGDKIQIQHMPRISS